MNKALQPMSLGEILDRTVQLYRSRFLVFLGIALIPSGVLLVSGAGIVGLFAWAGRTSAAGPGKELSAAFVFLFMAVCLLAVPVYLGASALGWAAIHDAAASVFMGEPVSILGCFRKMWKRGWRYLWLFVLLSLIVIIAPVAVMMTLTIAGVALDALARSAGMGALSSVVPGIEMLLMAVLVAYALWMLLRVCMAFAASRVEDLSAWSAVKRASQLSQGTRGRLFLLFLLGAALGWILSIGLLIPAWIAVALVPSLGGPAHSQLLGTILMLIWYVVWFAVQSFTRPVYGIALTLFYYDQRIRKEGFDIEWMMQQAGLAKDEPQPPELRPWMPPVIPAQAAPGTVEPATAEEGEPPLPGVAQP